MYVYVCVSVCIYYVSIIHCIIVQKDGIGKMVSRIPWDHGIIHGIIVQKDT